MSWSSTPADGVVASLSTLQRPSAVCDPAQTFARDAASGVLPKAAQLFQLQGCTPERMQHDMAHQMQASLRMKDEVSQNGGCIYWKAFSLSCSCNRAASSDALEKRGFVRRN